MPTRVDTVRAGAVAALLLLAAVALRGQLPGAPPTDAREPAVDNPAATIGVLAVLLAAVGVIAWATVVRARQRKAPRAASPDRPDWLRADASTRTWRVVLLVAAGMAAWLSLLLVLSRFDAGPLVEPPAATAPMAEDPAPPDAPAQPRPAEPAREPEESPLFGWMFVATAAFLAVLTVGSLATLRRTPAAEAVAPFDAEPDDMTRREPESLARAAELALAAVEDSSRDPRAAIIACYAAMERELSRVPGAAPQDFDTASEVLARAVAQHALGPDTATQLVDLFDEARFSPHVMSERHRELASQALQRVLDELRVAP